MMSEDPDWLSYAGDRLEDVGLSEAGACLSRHFRAIRLMEAEILERFLVLHGDERSDLRQTAGDIGPLVVAVASARGETAPATFRRIIGDRLWPGHGWGRDDFTWAGFMLSLNEPLLSVWEPDVP